MQVLDALPLHAWVEGCRHQDFKLHQEGGQQSEHHEYHKNNAERSPGFRQEERWFRDAVGFKESYIKEGVMDDVLSSLLLKGKNRIIKIHAISHSFLIVLDAALQHISFVLKHGRKRWQEKLTWLLLCAGVGER